MNLLPRLDDWICHCCQWKWCSGGRLYGSEWVDSLGDEVSCILWEREIKMKLDELSAFYLWIFRLCDYWPLSLLIMAEYCYVICCVAYGCLRKQIIMSDKLIKGGTYYDLCILKTDSLCCWQLVMYAITTWLNFDFDACAFNSFFFLEVTWLLLKILF